MMKRIGLWAFIGLGVAVCWAFFAAAFSRSVHFSDWMIFRLSLPITWLGLRVRMGYYEATLLNTFAYAILGFIAEPFWRALTNHSRSRKVARP